jgi:hypothetical protein
VHLIELTGREQDLEIDTAHDARVSTRDVLGLVYASEDELITSLASDVQRLGQQLRARHLVLVRAVTSGPVSVAHFDVQRRRVVASTEVPASHVSGTDLDAFRAASEALMLERIVAPIPAALLPPSARQPAETAIEAHGSAREQNREAPTEPPVPLVQDVPEPAAPRAPAPSRPPPERKRFAWTWTAGAATLLAAGSTAALAVVRNNRGEELKECNTSGASVEKCAAIADGGRRVELARNIGIAVTATFAATTIFAVILLENRTRSGRHMRTAVALRPIGFSAATTF